ncbi:hypothetical protein QP555_08545 [Peptoniphilus lacrimalis]|uniref:hypothetical protein n=1 Tax=Peptoniphilus lacrimalis TaxID=33031 RepID=UPI00254A2E95|nr:hypothetical protein [Peptoniphilus lacrimalis]MDK7723050.1 hypothetical protein [Peptoniphilus lacrimalis]MDK7732652.1 hypothetical protein [Peptoniphilus lacrimalis]
MNDKQITKRFMALFLSLIMLIGIFSLDIFAETFTTTDTSGKSVVNTTDWQLKEENLKGKNYWPLAAKQYLREVSTTAEPMKNPMIGYGGYFKRPDGRTVIRLTMRKFDKVGTGVWHVMQMKLEDSFNEKVDWNDTQTGIYQGVSAGSNQGWYNDDLAYKKITQFATPSITDAGSINVKEVNIADNGNTGATAALIEVPINLVLKDGQSVDSFTKEPLVQIRMLARDKLQVACYTDAGSGRGNYSTYTFSSIVPIKHNYEQNLLREIRASVTPDRAFRAAGSSVLYNKEKGYIEVRHRYNKVAVTGNNLYGRRLGYRQTVNKKFFDVLKPKDASGTIAHIFSTSNNGLPTAAGTNRLDANGEPTSTGSVPVLKDNINFLPGSDLGFIQVAATDFNRDAEAQEGIKTNFTTNQPLDSWLDGAESLLNNGQGTTVRYYVDTDKVDKLLGGDDGLQYFPFYSAIIMDNKDGQYKYTFKLTKDVTLKAGDKIKIDFKTAYGAGLIGNSAKSRNREMRLGIRGEGTEMFLGSNFLNVDKGLAYEYTVQNGMAMKLKAGTELYLFANYPDGGEATLYFNNNKVDFYKDNYVVDKNPIVLDWQGTYSAGTVTTTFQKPDVDEIFLGDKKITGRTAYEAAEVNIRKSKADEEVQTIIAKPGNTSNKDDSRIDVVVNNVKVKGYEFDTTKPGNQKDGKTPRTFTMPELKRDMPLLFTNTNVETLAEESRPAVVEQVQAKVNFDLNGVKSKDNKDVIEKIAPLSKDYAVDIETGAANDNYKESGFEGENVKVDENNKTVTVTETIDGKDVQRTYQNVINHDGKVYDINNQDEAIAAKEKQALKLRQMPDKYDINVPQSKKLLGWTTIKLEDKVENGTKVTVAEQFNELKDKNKIIKDIADWQTVDAAGNTQNYIFDANSPIDKNRTVYAVFGEGINLILHSNNTAKPEDETTITVPLVISDVDKTNKILDAVSSATLSNMKDNLIIKELPKVPVTGEQADMDKITDTKAKLFNIPKNSFIGWTTTRYTNDNTSGFAAGNNNERIGEITTGLVAKGTKRIPQKTEWLQDLNKLQNTYYIPNGYSVAVRPSDIDEDFTEIKKAIDEGKDIHLYANYRPFFDVNVVASYKNIDPTVDPTHKYGKYVDTVDAAKKQATNIGLLKRTAVTNYGTPTVHQNANYYPLGDEGIQAWDGTEKTLTWKVPGFDELGQRLSYVSVVVPDNKVQAYKDFAVPNWGSLGLKTYLRINNNDGTTTLEPTAPHNLHDNAGNPYGDNLAKDQAYSLGVDAYTSATSRKAVTVNRQGTKEVTGYTIWNTSTPIDIPKPVFDNVWDTDTVVNLNWGDAERKADIKKIKLKVADGDEVVLEKQPDGTYKTADGTIKTTIFQNKLRIATLNLTGKEGKNIVAKYVVEKSGKEIEGPQGDIQINKKGTSAPVDRMKQTTNDATGNPVVEFDIPNPTLNKPTKDTVYQVQKWDDTNKIWVDVPDAKYTMTDTDGLGETKTISLLPKTDANPDGVANDDIIRIVSKQPDLIESASTQTMDTLGNVKGNIKDGITSTSVKGRNYVQLDMKGPEIDKAQAKDEAFRRFIDISAAIKEIPEGRKVTVEITYPGENPIKKTFEISTDNPDADKSYAIEYLNNILRKGAETNQVPTIKITAVDEYGNKGEKNVDYTATNVLQVKITGERAGKKFVKVTADKAGALVTIKVMRSGNELETATATISTAGTFERVNFTNRLASGDVLVVSGTATDNGKTFTTNPYNKKIK